VSWVLAFVGFAALIVLHELGHFAAAKAVGMRAEKFYLFFGKPLVKVRRGETEYGIGWIPAGGYVKITGMNPAEEIPPEVAPRAYYRQPVWKRLVVIAAGPAVNLVLAFFILGGYFWAAGAQEATRTVGEVQRGQPAAGVLMPGDELLAVDGRRGDVATLARQIGTHRCAERPPVAGCRAESPARLTIRRDGTVRTVAVTPVYDAELDRTRLGFGFGSRAVPVGAGEAASTSVDTMWDVTTATVSIIGRLFYDAEARDELGGAVGSYEVTRRTIEVDAERAVAIIGLISLSLAIVNLLPILPLDGGHIFWALAEKVRGRAIPFRVMERASMVGFVLILVLFAIGLQNDVERLSNGELERSIR
jgi:regulator of sigma E protease